MKLHHAIKKECVVTGVKLDNKDDALAKIAQTATRSRGLGKIPEKDIEQALRSREALGSTGFGNGIAIPHCRLETAKEFVVGILSVPEGVDFDSSDEEKVHLIVFIVGPESDSNEHIALLSEISHTLLLPGAYTEMLSARDPEVLLESFLRHTQDEVDTQDHTSKNLFHVFIQEEKTFRSILQILAAVDPACISVVEAKNAVEYLGKLPLFAGFWNDRQLDTCRTITALVEKKYTNEIIRRIEQVAGKLDKSDKVVLAVQDIFYAAGNLSN